ncbi:MAG: LCP family protein [Actinomycetota bacterium]
MTSHDQRRGQTGSRDQTGRRYAWGLRATGASRGPGAFGASGATGAGGRRRAGLLRVVCALALAVVGGAAVLASAALGGPGPRLGPLTFQLHRVDGARFVPTGEEPVFVLVVGHDARPGNESPRGDALHLIGVNPGTGQATVLNIPRDTYVTTSGLGSDKINAAYAVGGPQAQARAVSELVGVEVPFVVSTGFDGFQTMVDELGGVSVDIPVAMADANSGAFFDAGPAHLTGGEALALARNRAFADGDFTRTRHQGLIIVSALAQLRDRQPGLAEMLRWTATLLRHGELGGGGLADAYRLGRLALSIDPASVRTVTVPGVIANLPVAGSVVLVGAEAEALFADFRDDAVLQDH